MKKKLYFAVFLIWGCSNGAVALVLEGFGLGTLPKPMPQHHRTMPDRPYRADGGELGSYEPGVGEGAGELELESEPHRARASWIELERARATIGQASPSGRYGRSGMVQCHSTIGPRPIDRTVLTAESSGARSWELGSGEL